VAEGQSVLVQESYDPAWQARSEGKLLPVHKDVMGFMAIDVPPGKHDMSLTFVTPMENQLGRVLTVISILAVVALLVLGVREARK
jgi:uncharacterized membrane protein YfhO